MYFNAALTALSQGHPAALKGSADYSVILVRLKEEREYHHREAFPRCVFPYQLSCNAVNVYSCVGCSI